MTWPLGFQATIAWFCDALYNLLTSVEANFHLAHDIESIVNTNHYKYEVNIIVLRINIMYLHSCEFYKLKYPWDFSFHTCVGTVKKQCNCWLGKVSLLTLSTIIIVRRIGGHNGPLKYLRFDHWWCIHGLQCRSKHACQKNGLSSVAYVLGGPVYKTYIQFFLVDSFQFNNVEILLRGL